MRIKAKAKVKARVWRAELSNQAPTGAIVSVGCHPLAMRSWSRINVRKKLFGFSTTFFHVELKNAPSFSAHSLIVSLFFVKNEKQENCTICLS
jgi:hypothetical protein